ncbi:MAG: DNA internalization-related competence protein ComEC/Rec2 [Gammaproteobacteria bacterium]|nr:DNA internalization-related competence protein ComEC/Rec2 [Gammaproteobacteria bacterium]
MLKSSSASLMLPVFALAFFSGVLALQIQPQLVSLYWSGLLFPLLLFCYQLRRYYWLIFLFAGFFWANYHGELYLQKVVDSRVAGQNILITGRIDDLPVRQLRSTKFKFKIDQFQLKGYSGPVPDYVRLSWYYSEEELIPGQRWQFLVRLKPPSGFQNPGGFDYEAWLYQQNIQATGYIRKDPLNKILSGPNAFSVADGVRYQIKQFINTSTDSSTAALLNALAIGYRGDIDNAIWRLFINTGTNHLIAISGLHIGLIAGFSWFCLRQLGRIKYVSARLSMRWLLVVSFSAALIYAALAGFTIPTQRALIMLAVVYLGLFFYRHLSILHSLSMALILVLLWSPASALSAGFWLSFLAVAAISYSIGAVSGSANKLRLWLWPQIVVIVVLMPLSFYFFQQSSLVALLANLIAIPMISLLILPLLLLALLLAAVVTPLSTLLLTVSAACLSLLLQILHYLSDYEFAVWVHSEPGILTLLLAMLGLIVLFLPAGIPARMLSLFLLLPLLVSQSSVLPDNAFELHVLDVGQGLSVYIKTRHHHLLYDAAAKIGDQFDLGEKVVLPFLRQQHVSHLDKLVISNGDNDHIGGAQAVLNAINTEQVIGRDIETISHARVSLCKTGQHWRWDGVLFEILHPYDQHYRKRNNYSCVLKVSNAVNSVLITGDIENKAEQELLQDRAALLQSTVLIVPHHGSKTSSSLAFLHAVRPQLAIYSSGYLNRYRFPHSQVTERYSELGIKQLNTAKSGHISLLVDQNSLKNRALSYRQQKRRYWQRTDKNYNY